MSSTPEFAFAAVAAPHSAASAAGQAILAQGGNAIEAMTAMAATIAVVYPHMNGLGGDGVWLVREPGGKVRCLEALGAAGSRATIRSYFDKGHEKAIPARGPLAALTAPGAVAGWAQALELSRALGGRLPLADLLRDAIRHAREGCPVSPCEARTKPNQFGELKEAPGFAAAFLDKGEPAKAGESRHQEKLAETLDHLAHAGLMDFYRGDVAREIAADLAVIGSPVTRDDLKKQDARWRTPLSVRLKDCTIFNAPPPTQGLASLMILGLFERLDVSRPDSFEHVHALVEATKRAFAIRDRECADFQWPASDPERWLAPDVLEREAHAISMSRAATYPLPASNGDTVWMGAVDANGLAVSCIQSIYWEWGSGCVLPATGVLMNNRGIAFSLDDDSIHALRPGRRPFHTLNPPLASYDDGRVAVYGSMGGDGQPQFQAQVFSRVRFGMAPDAAVGAPRFLLGRTWGEETTFLKMEDGFDPSLVRAMERAGHEVKVLPDTHPDSFGHAGVLLRARDGRIRGAHDPRADGGAAGL
ncbi:MAG: gamma-glutamyltransferase family protein [Beijerinckiaceae bacterium]